MSSGGKRQMGVKQERKRREVEGSEWRECENVKKPQTRSS